MRKYQLRKKLTINLLSKSFFFLVNDGGGFWDYINKQRQILESLTILKKNPTSDLARVLDATLIIIKWYIN